MQLSEGCGFVKYYQRDMAQAAINALNGIYTMRVCSFHFFSGDIFLITQFIVDYDSLF